MKNFIIGFLVCAILMALSQFTFKFINDYYADSVCLSALAEIKYYNKHVLESYMVCENSKKQNSWRLHALY